MANAPRQATDEAILDALIDGAGGDARAALANSLRLNRRLMAELRLLAGRVHERRTAA